MRDASEHARFALDDAAYVLGALDEVDREAFERHLEGCPLCQAQVTELRGMPALLDAADLTGWDSTPVPETLLPALLWQVAVQRRHRRRLISTVAAVAACLITLVAVLGVQTWRHTQAPHALALQPVTSAAAAVKASVTLTPVADGTRLRVLCGHYPGSTAPEYPGGKAGRAGGYQTPTSYSLVVINKAGARQSPTSWGSGRDIDVVTSTNWPEQAIGTIEIVDNSGAAVLRLTL